MAKEIRSNKTDKLGRSRASKYPTLVKDRTDLNQKMMADKGIKLAVSPGTISNSMSEKEAQEQLGRLKEGKQFTGAAATMLDNAHAAIEHAKATGTFDKSRGWYFEANNHAKRLAARYGVDTAQAAGVIASMSGGGGEWNVNKLNAEKFIQNHVTGKHTDNVVQNFHGVEGSRIANAAAIMSGTHPHQVLGDLKEKNFFDNINSPESAGVGDTTQDQHQNNILRGWKKPWRGLGGGSGELQKPGVYRLHQEITALAGASHGLAPIEAQPVVWDAAKSIYGSISGTPTPTHPAFADYYPSNAVPKRFHDTWAKVTAKKAESVSPETIEKAGRSASLQTGMSEGR
jgi:hypothetical protein